MSAVDVALHAGASIISKSPHFRGLGRLYNIFNAAMLRLGARPIATVMMKNRTTMRVDLRTHTERHAFYRREYEAALMRATCSLLDPNSCFLDVGANVGFYSVAVAALIRSRAASGRVIAFEPFAGNYTRLTENLTANALNPFCSTHRLALSNQSADSFITLREDFLTGSTTGNAAIPTNEEFDAGFQKAPIRLEPLDTIWESYGSQRKIDFMKIDIEGHEDFCLQGARRTLETHRPTILMEVNKPYYAARGVQIGERFPPLIPEDYLMYRHADAKWQRISAFYECSTLDNVFLIPKEKLTLNSYRMFG